MDAEEARAATAPGGRLEFVHAGGKIEVKNGSWFEAQVCGAMVTACVHGRPTLIEDAEGRRAVLISYERYLDLLRKAGALDAAAESLDMTPDPGLITTVEGAGEMR